MRSTSVHQSRSILIEEFRHHEKGQVQNGSMREESLTQWNESSNQSGRGTYSLTGN